MWLVRGWRSWVVVDLDRMLIESFVVIVDGRGEFYLFKVFVFY